MPGGGLCTRGGAQAGGVPLGTSQGPTLRSDAFPLREELLGRLCAQCHCHLTPCCVLGRCREPWPGCVSRGVLGSGSWTQTRCGPSAVAVTEVTC